MGYVFGDSTPFPFDVDFIELIRHVVRTAVALLEVQSAIEAARAEEASRDQTRGADRARLDRLSEAARKSMASFLEGGPERQVRAAAKILDAARAVLDQELGDLEAQAEAAHARGRTTLEAARRDAFRALEVFLRRNDVPGTEVALRLSPDGDAYVGSVIVTTPFGVEATFDASMPLGHEWTRPRRVAELVPGTEVQIPQESGWLNRRIETRTVRLDRLFVAEIAASPLGSRVTLRRGLRSGPGYEFEITTTTPPRATLHEVDDDGHVTGARPLVLEDTSAAHVFALWNAILASAHDLMAHRGTMLQALFDGENLLGLDDPRRIAARLVEVVAPTVREIERRSGSPREFVLRRDLGEGRRQESYVGKTELEELVTPLPAAHRRVFAPFELGEVQRLTLGRPDAVSVTADLDLEEDVISTD